MFETVKKFGLGYCKLPDMLDNVSFFLRAITLNIDSRNKNRISPLFYVAVFMVSGCYCYVYIVSSFWFVFVRCAQNKDLLSGIIIFSLSVNSEIGLWKYCIMIINQKKVRTIIDGYLQCDAEIELGDRFSSNIAKVLRTVKKRAMVFWMIIMGNGFIFVTKPFLVPGRHYIDDIQILYGLEPMMESPNYEVAYLLGVGAVIFTCYLPSNISGLFIVLSGYIEAQLLALAVELTHIWTDAEEFYKNICMNNGTDDENHAEEDKDRAMNDFIRAKLVKIVRCHAMGKNLLSNVENVHRVATAIEFLLLSMGLVSELLGGLENTYIGMPFALVVVGMDCLIGQRILDANITFKQAVYDCKWEKYGVKNMRLVMIMHMNAQKTMKLTVGGVKILGSECFMFLIRSIYSAYTTLRKTM